jgi:hypothetical protein
MSSIPSSLWQAEERLGQLAMQFRGARNIADRQAIARDYSQIIEQLIESGSWNEMPAPRINSPTPGCPRFSLNTGPDDWAYTKWGGGLAVQDATSVESTSF